jgi:hypothetical protein
MVPALHRRFTRKTVPAALMSALDIEAFVERSGFVELQVDRDRL